MDTVRLDLPGARVAWPAMNDTWGESTRLVFDELCCRGC
jgi:hypothetical protein